MILTAADIAHRWSVSPATVRSMWRRNGWPKLPLRLFRVAS